MSDTAQQYNNIIEKCRSLFQKKTTDYGTAWRILRLSSLTDQIFIKAQRIRTVQETGENKVGEDLENEFVGIINYCIMAVIQMRVEDNAALEMEVEDVMQKYDAVAKEVFELMEAKNHDYGEAWRDMRVSSLTDLILMKLLRVKQIEDNKGNTIVSEGIDANYMDMLNYSVFALILMKEGK